MNNATLPTAATPAETAKAIRQLLATSDATYAGLVVTTTFEDRAAFFAGKGDILNVTVTGDGGIIPSMVIAEIHLSIAPKSKTVSVGMATPKINYLNGIAAPAIIALGRLLGDLQKIAAGNRVY